MDLHTYNHARRTPEKIAYKLVPSGESVTYQQLEARSNQCAQLLRREGLMRGSVIAIIRDILRSSRLQIGPDFTIRQSRHS